jgi:magnesium chelatase family protein
VAMIGGGTASMRPGEISLSHGGVLFLDEMGEFPAVVLDALRQPLEDGQVRVSRSRGSSTFPARFILVGAMNPCPCGEGGPPGACRCSVAARERYGRRLSAPLLDRFDMAVRVDRPAYGDLSGPRREDDSATVASRVARARQRARPRGVAVNAELSGALLDELAPLSNDASRAVERQVRSGVLSARGLHRIRRLARTVADLESAGEVVEESHLREALLLRCRRDLLLGEQR